ncbi:MAG: hypothetical protein PF961_23670, partial [Planctomycetota bacterium]|jgi:hypothetical protein|nr:hypothetical protein [Planctomycetota bacterium]
MSDVPEDAPAEAVDAAPDASDQASDKAPSKPPRQLRLGTLIVIPLLVIVAAVAVWLGGDAFLENRIASAIDKQGLERGDTQISADLFGGSVALEQVALTARNGDETRVVYSSPRTALDLAVLASISSGDAIINELTVADAHLDLRRFADGSIPGPRDLEAEEMEQRQGEELPEEPPPRDLVELYRTLRKWYDRAREYYPEGGDDDAAPEQPVRPAEDWNNAVRYFPTPEPGRPSLPRMLIRSLELSGTGVILPDSSPESAMPLDVANFTISGSNVTTRLAAGEAMKLTGSYATVAAGQGAFTLSQTATTGAATFSLFDVPLPVLADTRVSGDGLEGYNPKGQGELAFDVLWDQEALSGTLTVRLIDLILKPDPSRGQEAQEVAKALDDMRQLHQELAPDQPFVITWRLQIGGTLSDPEILDLGMASLLQAIKDSAGAIADAAKAKVKALAADATKVATDQAKGLIDDIKAGEDPEQAAKERAKELEQQGKKLEDEANKLKNLFGR